MDPNESEEILSDSLESLYGYAPITHSSAGCGFTHVVSASSSFAPNCTIALRTPDTHASNWSLHASSIWVASIYLADHISVLNLDAHCAQSPDGFVRMLELGAGAGLPGILISKVCEHTLMTLSDYPDDDLIRTLIQNVTLNGVADRCRVVSYAWGSDPAIFFDSRMSGGGELDRAKFDVIIAADTLWNSDLHEIFIRTLEMTLRESQGSRVYLFAGFHTGRYTLNAFLASVSESPVLELESVEEREVRGDSCRAWDVSREEREDEKERRRWILLITVRRKIHSN